MEECKLCKVIGFAYENENLNREGWSLIKVLLPNSLNNTKIILANLEHGVGVGVNYCPYCGREL